MDNGQAREAKRDIKTPECLNDILSPGQGNFPVLHQDGYAGEQDGSAVEYLGILHIASRAEAKKIEIGDAIGKAWATYRAGEGWHISLAHWDDREEEDCFVRLGNADARWE